MPPFIRSTLAGYLITLAPLTGWAGSEPEWAKADAEPPRAAPKYPAEKPSARAAVKPLKKTAAGSPKNYYEELFQPVDTKAELPAESVSQIAPLASQELASDVPPSTPLTHSEKPTGGVIKAHLESEAGSKSKIEQVKVETRPRTARIPVPPSKTRYTPAASSSSITKTSATRVSTHAISTPVSAGPSASAVSLEWVKKSEFNVGQECEAELVVKNTGTSAIGPVEVDAIFQSPVRLTSARPQPVEQRDRLTWTFESLAAGSEQRLSLKMIPSKRGDLGLTAQVRVTSSATASFRVEEPQLKVALKGPSEVMLGEGATQLVTVSNPGTGAAHDVKISIEASAGLEHTRNGKAGLEMDVGTIMPGESRTVRLPLTGIKGGSQSYAVTATSSAGVSEVASASIEVVAPSLAVTADGPALRYKGRNATFKVNVVNDGTVANNNVRVVQTVAAGFQFVSADHGGKYDPELRTVSWFLGRLESEQAVHLNCELEAVELGEFTQKVTVASDAGARAETALETKVDGTSSLTMELVDLDDPVEIGVETAYEVRVKNTGSKAATNVLLRCELPEGVQLLSAKGPTDAVAERHSLQFKPVGQIAAGQECVFRVHVKGLHDGNARVKCLVSSDSLTEPLAQEEQTKFYSDTRR